MSFRDIVTIVAGIIIFFGIIKKISSYYSFYSNNTIELLKEIRKEGIIKIIKDMLFMWNGLFALCVVFLILREILFSKIYDIVFADCFIVGIVNSTRFYINAKDIIGILITYGFIFVLIRIVKNTSNAIQPKNNSPAIQNSNEQVSNTNEAKEKPKPENKAKGLYREAKRKFDFEFEDFKYWIDEMIKDGVDLEYYDEGYEPNAELTPDGSDTFSLANTFIGCLIRRGAFDHTATLLDKGIKVDDREDWVKRLLMWFNFDMAELLIRGKAKLNPNGGDNGFRFYRFNFASDTKPEYKQYVFFRLKAIAELMKIYGDLEGYEFLTEKIKEQEHKDPLPPEA